MLTWTEKLELRRLRKRIVKYETWICETKEQIKINETWICKTKEQIKITRKWIRQDVKRAKELIGKEH